jgi:hypothetical protein
LKFEFYFKVVGKNVGGKLVNVKELKIRAKELGLKGYSRMKKSEIEAAIREASLVQEDDSMPASSERPDSTSTKADVSQVTLKELRLMGKARGVRGASTMRKSDLVQALNTQSATSGMAKPEDVSVGEPIFHQSNKYTAISVIFGTAFLLFGLYLLAVTEWPYGWHLFGLAMAFVALFAFLAFVAHTKATNIDEQVRAMRSGERVVGWVIGPKRHARFLDARFRYRMSWWFFGALFIPVLAAGIFTLEFGGFGWLDSDFLMTGMAGAPFAYLSLGFIVESYRRYRLRGHPCEVLISKKGIYRTGKFLKMSGLGVTVEETEVIPGDMPMLEVTVSQRIAHQSQTEVLLIPLTEGQAASVQSIVDTFLGSESSLMGLVDLLGEAI